MNNDTSLVHHQDSAVVEVLRAGDLLKVLRALRKGDFSARLPLDHTGVAGEIAVVLNDVIEMNQRMTNELVRINQEVGKEGRLAQRVSLGEASGEWRLAVEAVNGLIVDLVQPTTEVGRVIGAVASGDLAQTMRLAIDGRPLRGEFLSTAKVVNGMVEQLNSFAGEVTRVAREVGTEGKLGGQAKVPGAAGTWRDLTDNVNQLAGNLTTQVRAIADVATAVTRGDLTRMITVEASGEVAALKENINEMIRNLKDTTQKTTEQDWLKTNLARFTRMLQGQRDLTTVAQQILSELAPLVSAQYGFFYLAEKDEEFGLLLHLQASYAYKTLPHAERHFKLGEGLVGECAFQKRKILMTDVPPAYIQISSGLGQAVPRTIVVLPVLFEGEVNAVIELASFNQLSEIHQTFLDQLTESIGIVVNTIAAGMRTEALLKQSQSLNDQLGEKAKLLEIKNREVELAKQEIEEKAEQLALTSKYKSEFLANMSHELRTPLNSLLILSKMLSDNPERNLTSKQIEFAKTIHGSGTDLLGLINDILDLSKIESGTISVDPTEVLFSELRDYVEQNFRHVAQQKNLDFAIELYSGLPKSLKTDAKRLQQILKNLLSNAFKFTEKGRVVLESMVVTDGWSRDHEILARADTVIAFSVTDSGIGIPRDKQKIIFEAFQQADGTTSRKFGGTGLGLSISREIARLLGGELRVSSTPGKGSRFTLYIPRLYMGATKTVAANTVVVEPAETNGVAQALEHAPTDHFGSVPETTSYDDREQIHPADKVLLVVEDDPSFGKILLELGRSKGFKVVLATQGETALSLARRIKPNAITLDGRLPDIDGWVVLDQLKHDGSTRHIPVSVISGGDDRHRSLRMGAIAHVMKPASAESIGKVLDHLGTYTVAKPRNLLLVENDDRERQSIIELIGTQGVQITAVATAKEALDVLRKQPQFACMVLDLGLPDMTGLELLEKLKKSRDQRDLPIIVYTGKDLSKKDETALRRLADTIILKDVKSPERLIDETAVFLHRSDADLVDRQRQMLQNLRQTAPTLGGTTVLVVDDDVRNIFAVTSMLESHGAAVVFAESGQEGLDLLDKTSAVDAVLMDIMMPEMDGYEVIRRIRDQDKFRQLPIIALTAKAMKNDREKCIQAGASDYIAKPVDVDKLLSVLRVWLSQ